MASHTFSAAEKQLPTSNLDQLDITQLDDLIAQAQARRNQLTPCSKVSETPTSLTAIADLGQRLAAAATESPVKQSSGKSKTASVAADTEMEKEVEGSLKEGVEETKEQGEEEEVSSPPRPEEEPAQGENQPLAITTVPSSSSKRVHEVSSGDDEEEEEEATEYLTPIQSTSVKERLRSASKPPPRKKVKTEEPHTVPGTKSKKQGKVLPPLVISEQFLQSQGLEEVWGMLVFQGWNHLWAAKVSVNLGLVQEFYTNFSNVSSSVGASIVKGEELSFTSKKLGQLLSVPSSGFSELPSETQTAAVKTAKAAACKRLFGSPTVVTSTNSLNLVQRIAHQVIIKAVVPRQERRTTITGADLLLLDCLINREKIDLPKIIIQHMGKCTGNHSLPYAGLVKEILMMEQLYVPEDEVTIGSELEQTHIAKMKFQGDDNGTTPPVPQGEGTVSSAMLQELKEINTKLDVVIDMLLIKFGTKEKEPET